MKITNPSVTLKDGLWYGYTVEVPEEPDYCTMTECDPYELCGCRKNKIYYEESLDSANASLVKIRNQEEVSRVVLTSLGCSTGVTTEDLQKAVDRKIKPESVYRLDGYEMAMGCNSDCPDYPMNCCHPSGCDQVKKVATISPIQKQNFTERYKKIAHYESFKQAYENRSVDMPPDNQEELKRKVIHLIRDFWKFDNNQQPMSSWHDKQDLIERIEKL